MMTKNLWMNGRLTKILVSFLAVAVLSGCSYLETARGYAADGVAKGVIAECAASDKVRCENYEAVVNELAKDQRKERPSPLDCDGDGAPDQICPLPE